MRIITYDNQRKRLWVCDKRIHHGLVGLLLWSTGTALIVHDWADRWWLKDNP